ncbi:GntR family transcriptional regulator [Jonesiaceae bacterium BS-20]|uniref:GntR family transcriptional regulator n=1 Tax=Jonesiaceae bacterium BS-20 TaxID=3120821 RepID=A0AAU7DVY8_9MICO
MITLNPTDPVPAFEQIKLQIEALIRSGTLIEGHKLPSIRQLAADLQTAPGTVARAYTELETTGLIEASKAKGTRVRGDQILPDTVQRAAQTYLDQVSHLTLEQAIGAVRAQWNAKQKG